MRPIWKGEKGFGLAETIVAAVILLLVALAGATIFYQGVVSTVNTQNATEAVHIAQQEAERLRAIAMNPSQGRTWIQTNLMPISPYTDHSVTVGNDLPATMTVTIACADDSYNDFTNPPECDYLVVAVEVDWEENNQSRSRRVGTIIQ